MGCVPVAFPLICLLFCHGFSVVQGKQAHLRDPAERQCRHGNFNATTKKCECDPNWGTAGITDTIEFLEGVCEQYHCVDDKTCKKVTGDSSATCPVEGWNCYCGWAWSWENYGHGWETFDHGGAECMGVMYTFSIWATRVMEEVMRQSWFFFAVAAVVSLPFGRKRAICDHHRPSLWLFFRQCCCGDIHCDGQCVLRENYDMDWFFDDIAWTYFWVEMGVWFYLFCLILYIIALFIWSFILWLMVLLIVLAVAIGVSCMTCVAICVEGAAGACDCVGCGCLDCFHLCGGAAHAAGGAANATAGGLQTADVCNCCHCELCNPPVSGGPSNVDALYFNGAFPQDPCWGYWGHGHVGRDQRGVEQQSARCCGLCYPFALMLYVFPALPENAWGGILGYFVLGTHAKVPYYRAYTGITDANRYSCRVRIIEFLRMGWLRRRDLHEETQWRELVRDFVAGERLDAPVQGTMDQSQPPAMTSTPSGRGQFHRSFTSQVQTEEARRDRHGNKVLKVSHARVHLIEREFEKDLDRCFDTSFQDYVQNKCWICFSDNDKWDMWTSCHHLFCQECSETMLKKRMPCPLCRVMSSTVLRGYAHGMSPDLTYVAQDNTPLLSGDAAKSAPQDNGPL